MFPFGLKKEWAQADLDRMLKASGWERNQFYYNKGDYASNFSEQGYFYDFSSGAMFDDPTSLFKNMLAIFTPVAFGDYAGTILLIFMGIGIFTGSFGSLLSMGKYLKEQGSVVSEE